MGLASYRCHSCNGWFDLKDVQFSKDGDPQCKKCNTKDNEKQVKKKRKIKQSELVNFD